MKPLVSCGVLLCLILAAAGEDGVLHKTISVKFGNVLLGEALQDIAGKIGVSISGEADAVKNADAVTYEAHDLEAGRVLSRILLPRGLKPSESGGAIVLRPVDPQEQYKPARAEIFEFTEKPRLSRHDRDVTISFASKEWCDCTVAIEDAAGKIVRHLASGVLGDNAPEPLQWNSKRQTLVWDGKDDQEQYVGDQEALTVRVSLGLSARFERTLFWSPYKRAGNVYPAMLAAPEGVYVADGDGNDHIRLYDHQGNYLHAVYPFPAGKLPQVSGLEKTTRDDGKVLPTKIDCHLETCLPSGTSAAADPWSPSEAGCAVLSMASFREKLACAYIKLIRLAPDGSSGGMPFVGPTIDRDNYRPQSCCFSPDGKFLYFGGYRAEVHNQNMWHKVWVNAITRMEFASDQPPSVLAGEWVNPQPGPPEDGDKFKMVTSIDCDPSGRIYVADYLNDRIRILDADGKQLKSIAVNKPAKVRVHQKTGDVFVFSWAIYNQAMAGDLQIPATYTHFGPYDDPKVKCTAPLPLSGYAASIGWLVWNYHQGTQHIVEMDSWTEQPTIWILNGAAGGFTYNDDGSVRGVGFDAAAGSSKIYQEEDGKLAPKKDFGAEVAKIVRHNPPVHQRQRLYVNPSSGKLYVAEGDSGVTKSVNQLVEIDADSGKIALVDLPLGAEDLCFDLNNLIYIRTDPAIARFEFGSWREVPWDYGEELVNHSFGMGARAASMSSALLTPGHRDSPFWHGGGMWISPLGHLAVATCNLSGMSQPAWKPGETHFDATGRPYQPMMFPGRQRWGEIHIYDRYGNLVRADAAPGFCHLNGVHLDSEDNLYLLTNSGRVLGEQTLPGDTLVKVAAGKAFAVSDGAGEMIPVPVAPDKRPQRPLDMKAGIASNSGWVVNGEWLYGGIGTSVGGCICRNCRFSADYFNRSFAPEVTRCSVAVLDANGNLIMRIGQYGNVEDGKPLIADGGPNQTASIGGDEVALFTANYVATHTDHRLFIADAGNARILSVKLGYHAEAKLPLRDVPVGK